jgi:hypothetical protein
MTSLLCYRVHDGAPTIVPAAADRAWMDATPQRFAYRCLPLSIANSMGWELRLTSPIVAEWNGGKELADITVTGDDGKPVEWTASSHFGSGVLTFQTGYLFRTDPSVALWVRGVPNRPKDGIAPLEGVVETDWLSFTFTMNWMFTRPGRVRFEADEPFCFITPVNYRALETIRPEIAPIAANPELAAAYMAYREQRLAFNARLTANDPDTVAQGWQKWYTRGETPTGDSGSPLHMSHLRVAAPVERSPRTP